jgi:hypothetical protein
LRMLRNLLHGFTALEASGGFRMDASVDDSFTWIIDFLDHGLQPTADTPDSADERSIASARGSELDERRERGRTRALQRHASRATPSPTDRR